MLTIIILLLSLCLFIYSIFPNQPFNDLERGFFGLLISFNFLYSFYAPPQYNDTYETKFYPIDKVINSESYNRIQSKYTYYNNYKILSTILVDSVDKQKIESREYSPSNFWFITFNTTKKCEYIIYIKRENIINVPYAEYNLNLTY